MDKDWSLTDCISFHLMRTKGITRALAYDEHFAQAGFEPLLRRQP
jgi:predicted nucleic acid-binding protein